MLVIFVALWRIFFSPELISLLRLSMLRQRIWSDSDLSPMPLRSAVSRSRSSVMLSIIIGVNILNWYGAVIAQSGRQFDESDT